MNDPSIGSADALAALRLATSAQHEVLDTGLPLARADASLHDYLSHLRMLSRWLAPIEAWQAGFADGPQSGQALPRVDRLAVIDADLAAAGEPRNAASRADAPWPPHASPAYRWGVAYVVEGSQLGGAVLYKRLAERLAPHPLAYLKGAAEGPGPRWRAFMAALKADVQGEAAVAQACLGAQDAFARILALRDQ
jgi:heme oxygenase